MITCYIGLGSNLDNPQQQIVQAIDELSMLVDCQLCAVSSIYRSKPLAGMDQPDYINAVARLDTVLTPHVLLDKLQEIENLHDRKRLQHWGPRTLDLDLLLYGDQMFNDERLVVPHPGLDERNFVLYPLAEITINDMTIPGMGSLAELQSRVTANGLEKLNQ
ncbi:MAG: 2-amino-4-hydroxy-6-hydroxymethyldihydropteridine diphosphokinase [Gammaproteobacteria bacterium]|nr:2-amino-4-hydroxy-6-hydroxymethyldihydropteridine diphosphokinase [Gammaproteobacteria bacterium]